MIQSTNFTRRGGHPILPAVVGIQSETSALSNLEFEICNLELGDEVISIDPNYYRPTEVDLLIGDPSKAKKKLDWQAETKIDELVRIMVESDFNKVVEKGY